MSFLTGFPVGADCFAKFLGINNKDGTSREDKCVDGFLSTVPVSFAGGVSFWRFEETCRDQGMKYMIQFYNILYNGIMSSYD